MTVKPSRFLNEKSGFLGLGPLDFAVIGYTLILTHSIFSGLELVAFLVTGILSYFIVNIRLKFRAKIVRDYLQFHLRTWRIL